MKTGEIEEKALNVGESGRSAKDIFALVRETMEDCGISFDGLVSQAFDRASVMSGERGGLQALISQFCQRTVCYIHWLCHRLHLVVENVMKNSPELKEYFGVVSGLYKFFKVAPIKEEYSVGKLKRLIETRWSGYLAACKAIDNNYGDIVKTLNLASKNKELDSTIRATAVGFWTETVADEFFFLTNFILDVLKLCDIANKTLQSSKENLNSAMLSIAVIHETIKETQEKYSDAKSQEIIEKGKGGKLLLSLVSSKLPCNCLM